MTVAIIREKSPVRGPKDQLFFSLVDYRNNYFTSDDPNKIIEFYNGFENRDQLIQWMKERPKGIANIHEVSGDKDIVVVIPTADINGKFAKECRENIFKGLHIVFVESGGRGDFYFNFAHNVNVGIRKAMEYIPKWVVVSNDDMVKIDDISVLIDQLERIDNHRYMTVYTEPSTHHSTPSAVTRPRLTRTMLFKLLGRNRRYQLIFEKKFCINFFLTPVSGYWKLFFKQVSGRQVTSLADIGIFSAELLRVEHDLYNETFVNSAEDFELSIRLAPMVNDIKIIHYRIGSYIGLTLGNDINRRLRELGGQSYLNYLLSKCDGMLKSPVRDN